MTTKEWLEQLDESEYRIYCEGFEAAKAAALKYANQAAEISVGESKWHAIQAARLISELQPEAHNG